MAAVMHNLPAALDGTVGARNLLKTATDKSLPASSFSSAKASNMINSVLRQPGKQQCSIHAGQYVAMASHPRCCQWQPPRYRLHAKHPVPHCFLTCLTMWMLQTAGDSQVAESSAPNSAAVMAPEAAAQGAAAAAAAATALGQLAAALASQAPLPDSDGSPDTLIDTPGEANPPPPTSSPEVVPPSPAAAALAQPAAQPHTPLLSAFQPAAAQPCSTPASTPDAAPPTYADTPPRLAPAAQLRPSRSGPTPSGATPDAPAPTEPRDVPPGGADSAPGPWAHTLQPSGSGRLGPTASGSFRSRSGALSGGHPGAGEAPTLLNSLGSGSLLGGPAGPSYALGERLHEAPAVGVRFSPPRYPSALDAPAPGAGLGPYAYPEAGPSHLGPASGLSTTGLADEGRGQVPTSQLHAHATPFAPLGIAGSHYLVGSQGLPAFASPGQGFLYARQERQAGPLGGDVGFSTLPPAAALEGGVLESEMANDEAAEWRHPGS